MNDPVKILIVEDDVLIADYIREILEEHGYKNVYTAHRVKDAKEKMRDITPEIILMDINLEGNFEGIELSRDKNEGTSIIFITGQGDARIIEEALKVFPESYLTKPIRELELLTAVKITASKKQKKYIFVKAGYGDEKLMLNDIIYIKSDKNYLDIFTESRKITVRNTLLEFCKELPSTFVQVHRSIVVNTRWVEHLSSYEITVKSIRLPVSRNFTKNLTKK